MMIECITALVKVIHEVFHFTTIFYVCVCGHTMIGDYKLACRNILSERHFTEIEF